MKLTELFPGQKIIVQLAWGEQKIEFFSDVLEKDNTSTFVTPYIHNGSVLELNITRDKGVICNIFTDDPFTKQRISWKGIELTTVNRNGHMIYCLTTHGFNSIANLDDRRLHERVIVQIDATACDIQNDIEEYVTIRDISDTGLSFYASEAFISKSQQIVITFTDEIDKREFDIRLECVITRINDEEGRSIVGCKITSASKGYQIYELLKRLKSKNTALKELNKEEEFGGVDNEKIE